ncbi:MAG: hypothetical protein ACXVHI_04470 [Frankiaceae bacterium]
MRALAVEAALSSFDDVAHVFDYRAGRLGDAADGPGQGKAADDGEGEGARPRSSPG